MHKMCLYPSMCVQRINTHLFYFFFLFFLPTPLSPDISIIILHVCALDAHMQARLTPVTMPTTSLFLSLHGEDAPYEKCELSSENSLLPLLLLLGTKTSHFHYVDGKPWEHGGTCVLPSFSSMMAEFKCFWSFCLPNICSNFLQELCF